MRILIGIIVLLVIVGGVFWFMSSSDTTMDREDPQEQREITESSSIESSDEVFTEIDNALEGLE